MSKQQWASLTTDTQKLQLFGTSVKVTTNFGDSFQGLIYYYDESILILKNDDDYYLVNQQSIQDLQTINIQDPKQTLQNLLSVDLAAMAQEMIKREMKEPHQQLFDHLQKLYRDVDWKDNEIIIPSISIRICPPYKSDNISGENKKGVERLKKIVSIHFLPRWKNMAKTFEYSIVQNNSVFVIFIFMNNREEDKQQQQAATTANNDEEDLRKEYMQDLQKRVKELRKKPDCCECCFAYWLFVLLGFLFNELFKKKIDETPDGCDFIGLVVMILMSLFSLSACCRCIDGCCIILPCKNTRCFHLSLEFHELNNLLNFQTCKWGLIILTVIWVLNYSCIVFWPMFMFLLITWILVLVWKMMESE